MYHLLAEALALSNEELADAIASATNTLAYRDTITANATAQIIAYSTDTQHLRSLVLSSAQAATASLRFGYTFLPNNIVDGLGKETNTIFVLTDDGSIHRTDDAGDTWEVVHQDATNKPVALCYDSSSEDGFWFACLGGKVIHFASFYGEGAKTVYDGPPLTTPTAICFRDTDLLVAGDGGLIYASEDFGATWSLRCSLPVTSINHIVEYGVTLYAATTLPGGNGALYTSTNAGATWTAILTNVAYLTKVRVSANAIIAIGYQWRHRSTNGGSTWTTTQVAYGTKDLAYNGDSDTWLLSNGAIYKSIDHGATWSLITSTWDNSINVPRAYSKIIDAGENAWLIGGQEHPVISTDDGANFSALGPTVALHVPASQALQLDLNITIPPGLFLQLTPNQNMGCIVTTRE